MLKITLNIFVVPAKKKGLFQDSPLFIAPSTSILPLPHDCCQARSHVYPQRQWYLTEWVSF